MNELISVEIGASLSFEWFSAFAVVFVRYNNLPAFPHLSLAACFCILSCCQFPIFQLYRIYFNSKKLLVYSNAIVITHFWFAIFFCFFVALAIWASKQTPYGYIYRNPLVHTERRSVIICFPPRSPVRRAHHASMNERVENKFLYIQYTSVCSRTVTFTRIQYTDKQQFNWIKLRCT